MLANDDIHSVDKDGNLVLAGLSADETREFRALDPTISTSKSFQPSSHEQEYSADERRWLALLEKHVRALKPFLDMSKTRH